jgi:hypothetical protein
MNRYPEFSLHLILLLRPLLLFLVGRRSKLLIKVIPRKEVVSQKLIPKELVIVF